jgi:organic radical activating enzyme
MRIIPLNVDPAGNVSPSHYKQYEKNSQLLVHSMFRTLQGEGPYAGCVAHFVRLGGCNLGAKLACEWCDTAFAVGDSKAMTVDQIVAEINQAQTIDPNHLTVITGGEPLLQGGMLLDLVNELDKRGGSVQIETNGLYLAKHPELAKYCVVSPKVAAISRVYPDMTKQCINTEDILGFKFVVEADPESDYHTAPNWAFEAGMQFAPLYISPMAVYLRSPDPAKGEVSNAWDATMVDHAATARNYAWAAEYVLALNKMGISCALSLQTHLFINMP